MLLSASGNDKERAPLNWFSEARCAHRKLPGRAEALPGQFRMAYTSGQGGVQRLFLGGLGVSDLSPRGSITVPCARGVSPHSVRSAASPRDGRLYGYSLTKMLTSVKGL